ncbi:MAG: glycosyltransferase family 2 protein [Alphaproteobacteria bacterium]
MSERPLVSVIMPMFEMERYVAAAFASILAQDYSPLEIVVSDNASTDRTFAVVQELAAAYRGPHRIRLHRNDRNLWVENQNVCAGLSEGAFLVQGHSDDVSHPDRVSRLVAAWQQTGAAMVCSNALVIDQDDRELGLYFPPNERFDLSAEAIVAGGYVRAMLGAAHACVREVYERFPKLSAQRTPSETDTQVPLRAALIGPIHVVREPLLRFRLHRDSFSGRKHAEHRAHPLGRREGAAMRAAQQRVAVLDLLNSVAARRAAGDRHADLHRLASQAVLRAAFDWTEARNALIMAGLAPDWVARD